MTVNAILHITWSIRWFGNIINLVFFMEVSQVPCLPHTGCITSVTNRYVKHCVRLRTDGKYRRSIGRLVLPGSQLLQELQGGFCAVFVEL